ncbi:MAG: bifunctional riboflavin kinase/FAD synthetase [Bacteroidales bacterium]|nr:bifunctional riboflavin kinase/FAD synthetase [Bacteroidales bacterium]
MEILELENITSLPCNSVATIGMFDGVHKGHQFMLQELKNIAQRESCKSVVITFANHPREVLDSKQEKNPIELLQTNSERYSKIKNSGIDYLITIPFTKEFAQISPKAFLDILKQKINIQTLLLGYDNSFGNPNNEEFKEIISKGEYSNIKIIRDKTALYEDDIEISSSEIRKAISNGNISLANKMLGEYYSLSSNVEKGFQLGTTLGFPTANIFVPNKKLIPKNGVYATLLHYNDNVYKSVTNIGYRPTFHRQEKTIETFIFDFNENIYDKEVRLQFIDYIREEKKFESADLLAVQIEKDCEDAKKILA